MLLLDWGHYADLSGDSARRLYLYLYFSKLPTGQILYLTNNGGFSI